MAPAQPTFSDLEASSGRVTRRRRFLALLDSKIPWGAWAARVEPHYPKAGGGRPPVPLGTMLRMYVVQVAFQLSDEGTEDALWDSAVFCQVELSQKARRLRHSSLPDVCQTVEHPLQRPRPIQRGTPG